MKSEMTFVVSDGIGKTELAVRIVHGDLSRISGVELNI